MKKMLAGVAAILLLAACNRFEKTPSGIEYKVIKTTEDGRMIASEDNIQIHMLGVLEKNDSALFDSYKANKPYYIPAGEPTLKEVFAVLKKGDSAIFKVIADTLFGNFGAPLPAGVSKGDIVKFYVNVVDIYNSQEMQKKIDDQNHEFLVKDSIAAAAYLNGVKDVITTSTGLKYQIIAKGNGKAAKKGDNITVKYRGSLLDGTVFDESKPDRPDFTFNIGEGGVIPGWDEAFQLMKEGDKLKLIIPWGLGYGPRGNGPIPPYATLIFDVELVKINKK